MNLSFPDYDKTKALTEQKHLLTLKKERLERLISALDGAMKGEIVNMNIFDNSEFEAKREEYAKETKAWSCVSPCRSNFLCDVRSI